MGYAVVAALAVAQAKAGVADKLRPGPVGGVVTATDSAKNLLKRDILPITLPQSNRNRPAHPNIR